MILEAEGSEIRGAVDAHRFLVGVGSAQADVDVARVFAGQQQSRDCRTKVCAGIELVALPVQFEVQRAQRVARPPRPADRQRFQSRLARQPIAGGQQLQRVRAERRLVVAGGEDGEAGSSRDAGRFFGG